MRTFDVYPKEGDAFTIECNRFDFDGQQFTLYDSADRPSKDGFVSPDNVAAIIAQKLPKPDYEYTDTKIFRVHLKKRQPIEIAAHSFDTSQASGVKFYWHPVDPETGNVLDREISGIYITLSEVVVIVPADGVRYNR